MNAGRPMGALKENSGAKELAKVTKPQIK